MCMHELVIINCTVEPLNNGPVIFVHYNYEVVTVWRLNVLVLGKSSFGTLKLVHC